MKASTVSAAVVVCVVVALGSAAWAGVEPSPWQPQINQLNAIENGLRSISERVDRVLNNPPDPWMPPQAWNGPVGRLNAMANQLDLLDGMLVSIMDEVLGVPPDPFVPAELVPALEGVRGASQGIADTLNAYLANPPDPWVPAAFRDALSGVGLAAQAIADDAVQYLGYAGCPDGEPCGCLGEATPCAAFLEAVDCIAQVGCFWSTVPQCEGTPAACSSLVDETACVSQGGCWAGFCQDGICQ